MDKVICRRCRAEIMWNDHDRCPECGVKKGRPVKSFNSMRRRTKVGGKRGRNSGKVNSAKSK